MHVIQSDTILLNMSEPISLTLPTLPRYSGVPKRYEETRPVLIQDFSHRRILGRGLHNLTLKFMLKVIVIALILVSVLIFGKHFTTCFRGCFFFFFKSAFAQ